MGKRKMILNEWHENEKWEREALAMGSTLWSFVTLHTESVSGPVKEIVLYLDPEDQGLTMRIRNFEP